jgi:hypothetical protein
VRGRNAQVNLAYNLARHLMSLRAGLLVSLTLALAAAPGAQQPVRTARRSVTGVVRDAITRAPIAGARVRVAPFNEEWCEPCLAITGLVNATTDSGGRFSLDEVPETFVLEADKTGYAEGGFGVRRPAGARRASTSRRARGSMASRFCCFREAVITGRVIDETGAPVAASTSKCHASTRTGDGPCRRGMGAMANRTSQ